MCFAAGQSRKDLKGKIELKDCNEKHKKAQQFRTYDPADVKDKFQFKILKSGNSDMCLSQDHHPRDKEELRFFSCSRAKANDKGKCDDTSHWAVGAFDGH